ncbi:MAG: glycosyltransferase [Chloroflexi bacterium]|nr:glycosyltransferase [Chloroflexota bacterium]MDA1146888.1 glycosyltransferase [Chloroflexota bacterium]
MSTAPIAPLVTVAIATRNRAALLAIALESAINQTFTDIEILVLDDASTDGTSELVARYTDPRIRYVRHDPNIGMAANWNYGYVHGRGEYVAVLHDDDYWLPTFLERAVAEFRIDPTAALVFAPYATVDEQGAVVGDAPRELTEVGVLDPPPIVLEQLVRTTWIGWPSIMIRRECMLEIGGFRETFPYHKDWAVWLQLAARWPVRWIPEQLGVYRVHGGQFSEEFRDTGTSLAEDRYQMLWETIPTLPVPNARRALLLRGALEAFAEQQLVLAWDLAKAGDGQAARQQARFAFHVDRTVLMRSPPLVVAAFVGSYFPPPLIRGLDRLRGALRPIFRRA